LRRKQEIGAYAYHYDKNDGRYGQGDLVFQDFS
jgi:hypothetical protein